MTPRKPAYGAIFRINAALFGAFGFAFAAWVLWPDSFKWWGFGLLSIMFGMAAPACLIHAGILIFQLYERDKELAEFEQAYKDATPSELAGDEALRKAGVKQ
mgnify:CR=1 FL=1